MQRPCCACHKDTQQLAYMIERLCCACHKDTQQPARHCRSVRTWSLPVCEGDHALLANEVWSSGCTATAVSPRMVSGRVVATGTYSSKSATRYLKKYKCPASSLYSTCNPRPAHFSACQVVQGNRGSGDSTTAMMASRKTAALDCCKACTYTYYMVLVP